MVGNESLAFGVIRSLRSAVIFCNRYKSEVRGQRAEFRILDCGLRIADWETGTRLKCGSPKDNLLMFDDFYDFNGFNDLNEFNDFDGFNDLRK